MYSYRLSKTKDVDFFSAPHYDAISTALIKDGDVVCVCNNCEELFLESSWKANDNNCSKCGGSSKKNIDERYFHKYRINTQKVTNKRNHGTGHRRNMVPLGTVNRPMLSTNTVTRRPVRTSLERSGGSPIVVNGNTRRPVSTPTTVGRPHQTIDPQPYPPHRKRRKKTGRILLGIVISILLIELTVFTLFVLDHNGVIDISGVISSITANLGLEDGLKELVISITDKTSLDLLSFSKFA